MALFTVTMISFFVPSYLPLFVIFLFDFHFSIIFYSLLRRVLIRENMTANPEITKTLLLKMSNICNIIYLVCVENLIFLECGYYWNIFVLKKYFLVNAIYIYCLYEIDWKSIMQKKIVVIFWYSYMVFQLNIKTVNLL